MQTFVYIAQGSFEVEGRHYESGDRLIADPFIGAPLLHRGLVIIAPSAEQRAHGAPPRMSAPAPSGDAPPSSTEAEVAVMEITPPPRRRGRPRKTVVLHEPSE